MGERSIKITFNCVRLITIWTGMNEIVDMVIQSEF
jgi:hypothetical protein